MFKTIIVVLLIGFLAWAFQTTQPPPPRICGTPGGPAISSPRIKLRDGRHLAYKEHGVPKETAKYKLIFIHGFGSGKKDGLSILTPEIAEELGVYLVSFDRPGYGESDPDPKRTMKSIALDIEELADQLGLGSRFYVIGFSMGGQVVWACLKYIPQRLAGAALIAPVVNYWLPGFPANMSKEAYNEQFPQDQWALRVAHYTPWLTYWWNTQKWFPASSVIAEKPKFSRQDVKIMTKLRAGREKPKEDVKQQGEFESIHRDLMIGFGSWEFDPMDLEKPFPDNEGSVHLWQGDEDGLVPVLKPHGLLPFGLKEDVKQQGEFESIHRDLMIGFGSWEFDPMDLEKPFPDNEGSVHLWQGDEDGLVPVTLQRYIAGRLPWIHYHEIPEAGHMFPYADGMKEAILKTFLLGEK